VQLRTDLNTAIKLREACVGLAVGGCCARRAGDDDPGPRLPGGRGKGGRGRRDDRGTAMKKTADDATDG